MKTRQSKKEADLHFAQKRISKEEISTLSQILDALDVHKSVRSDIRSDDSSHINIVCWDKPAEEIEQALTQISSRYQDAVDEKA